MRVVQAYRFALNPTPQQERALRSHAGAARFAWNWGLARCIERNGGMASGIRVMICTSLERGEESRSRAGMVGREFEMRLPGSLP